MMRLIILLMALIAFNVSANPQEMKISPYFSALIVKDIDKSIHWYQKTLGFEVVNRVDMMAQRGFKQANLKRDGMHLELIETNKTFEQKSLLADKPKKSKVAGYFKLGFRVNQFDKWVNWLRKSQVTFYGDVVQDPVTQGKTLLFLDPDGNRIQLFSKGF